MADFTGTIREEKLWGNFDEKRINISSVVNLKSVSFKPESLAKESK